MNMTLAFGSAAVTALLIMAFVPSLRRGEMVGWAAANVFWFLVSVVLAIVSQG